MSQEHAKIKQILRSASNSNLFKLAVQNAFNHIIITDPDGVILYANSAVARITGYSSEEITGKTPRLWGRQMSKMFYDRMWKTIKEDKKPFVGEITNRRRNGQQYIAKAIISPILDDDGELLGFVGTEEDITKQKEVDEMKSEFISITAHQLRTPLTAIRWTMEGLIDGTLGELNQRQIDTLLEIQATNARLINLVNDLLNIARIESGRLAIDPRDTNLPELISTLIEEYNEQAAEKKISLSLQTFGEIPIIKIDTKLVTELLTNILSNAIKYSDPSSVVKITLSKTDGNILVCIKDHGIGIDPKEADNIFNKYYRTESAKDLDPNGAGLGLYFAKQIIDYYHGRIWFDSVPGEGTSFYFTIPVTGMPVKEGEISLS